MSALIRYETPAWDLSNVLDEMFSGSFFSSPSREIPASTWPRVDIAENENTYSIHADLPGLEKQDIKVEVQDGVLSISGEKKENKRDETKGRYYHFERRYGSFSRSFCLPDHIDTGSIDAKFKNGVLELTMKKVEKEKPKAIEVAVE